MHTYRDILYIGIYSKTAKVNFKVGTYAVALKNPDATRLKGNATGAKIKKTKDV